MDLFEDEEDERDDGEDEQEDRKAWRVHTERPDDDEVDEVGDALEGENENRNAGRDEAGCPIVKDEPA